jgi:hypothetical protein
MENYVKSQWPNNPVLKEVGAPVGKNKVTLPYYMGSMDKNKADAGEVERWVAKYPGACVI